MHQAKPFQDCKSLCLIWIILNAIHLLIDFLIFPALPILFNLSKFHGTNGICFWHTCFITCRGFDGNESWLKLYGLYSLFNSSLINTDLTIPKLDLTASKKSKYLRMFWQVSIYLPEDKQIQIRKQIICKGIQSF